MAGTRRNFLKIIGGGTIVAAAGIGGFVATRTPHKALEPWELAGGYEDVRKNALSFALLAPNPHNRQPWMVDLASPDTVVVYRDREKDLPETDPHDRQLTIGMGCFLELLRIAASQQGKETGFDLFPEGEDGPVAVCHFRDGASPDPLFAHVMERRSCKEPFADTPVEQEKQAALADLARIVSDDAMVEELRQLTHEAWLVEAHLPRTMRESAELFRIGKSEVNANPDGIDFSGPFFETLGMLGMFTRETAMDTSSTGFKQGLDIYRDMLMATPAYAVITSSGNSRIDQIEAGRRWLRLNLTTTSLGLSLHPVSQALQEFPEMAKHYDKVHAMLAEPGHTVQMLGRLGYGPTVPRSPRWPLEEKLLNA